MNKIEDALSKLFNKHRIIFWYDEKERLKEEFEELVLGGVEKVVIKNNQFYVKYLISREKPSTQFLLYLPYNKPNNVENWLLDMELAYYVFQTRQEAMFAQELELDYDFTNLMLNTLNSLKTKNAGQI